MLSGFRWNRFSRDSSNVSADLGNSEVHDDVAGTVTCEARLEQFEAIEETSTVDDQCLDLFSTTCDEVFTERGVPQ